MPLPDQGNPRRFGAILQVQEFLSIEETALLIGASRSTIFRLISSNILKANKIGARSIYKESFSQAHLFAHLYFELQISYKCN